MSATLDSEAVCGRRIAYFVHGRGRGHASRALRLVPALRGAGARVQLFAAADALPVLQELEPLERPLLRRGPVAAVQLVQRARSDARLLRAGRVEALISDGDQGALLAARAAGVAALALGHDLIFNCCALPAGLDRRRLLLQRLNGLIPARLSTRRVAVNFLPTQPLDRATRVARPDARELSNEVCARRDLLVCYFRDGNGAAAIQFARRTGAQVVAADGREETLEPAQFRALLGQAAGVIASAGSSLIAECVLSGTPLLALYKQDDAEQALNASWLAAAEVGMACSFERLNAAWMADFVARARAGRFARVALAAALPSVESAVFASLSELLQGVPRR